MFFRVGYFNKKFSLAVAGLVTCYLLTVTCSLHAARVPAARAPATVARAVPVAAAPAPVTVAEPEPISAEPLPIMPLPAPVPEIIVDDRSQSFSSMFGGGAAGRGEETPMAAMLRRMRAEMGMLDDSPASMELRARLGVNTAAACDNGLRVCMSRTCGGDEFAGCALDSDTEWGMKMNTCRRQTECTGDEFAAFAAEIKADRDQFHQMSRFQAIMNCGVEYNNCIRNACNSDPEYTNCVSRGGSPAACRQHARYYEQCWGRAGEVRGFAHCEAIQARCRGEDSGMEGRAREMIAGMRVNLERNLANWEREIFVLHNRLIETCRATQGTLDDRSLHCVYMAYLYIDYQDGEGLRTVGNRRLHGGDRFVCTPEFFNVDLTTHIENAIRLTRSQTGATAALMGAGLGIAGGALASGAIGRAVEQHAADRAEADLQRAANVPPAQPQPTGQGEPPPPAAPAFQVGNEAQEDRNFTNAMTGEGTGTAISGALTSIEGQSSNAEGGLSTVMASLDSDKAPVEAQDAAAGAALANQRINNQPPAQESAAAPPVVEHTPAPPPPPPPAPAAPPPPPAPPPAAATPPAAVTPINPVGCNCPAGYRRTWDQNRTGIRTVCHREPGHTPRYTNDIRAVRDGSNTVCLDIGRDARGDALAAWKEWVEGSITTAAMNTRVCAVMCCTNPTPAENRAPPGARGFEIVGANRTPNGPANTVRPRNANNRC